MYRWTGDRPARSIVKPQACIAHVGRSPRDLSRLPLAILVVALGAIVHLTAHVSPYAFAAPANTPASNQTLPRPTADMRDAILHAVQTGKLIDLKTAMELNELRPDIANERIDDVIAYFKAQSKDGEGRETLAILNTILNLPPVAVPMGRDIENNAIYVWPYLAERDLTKLSPKEEADLTAMIPATELPAVRAAKHWTWWRLAISADGTWHSFRKEN
jgi:hypothetical protein